MVPFFIAGFYKYRNKEIHVHVLAKEKNNAQNYINIKTFLLYQNEKNYWQFHNFKPSKKYTNESKVFFS